MSFKTWTFLNASPAVFFAASSAARVAESGGAAGRASSLTGNQPSAANRKESAMQRAELPRELISLVIEADFPFRMNTVAGTAARGFSEDSLRSYVIFIRK
jgi:hypothetical protein